MNIAGWSIDKPVNTWLVVLVCLVGGLWGFLNIGRLEDPSFTIKEARVITQYPGATATEVELEVTERLESAIQQMPQIKRVSSVSQPGLSQINVEIQDSYDGDDLPQVWDELRRKITDTIPQLPSGVRTPMVNDDFGDVYGLFYAMTAPGYSHREIKEIAKDIRRKLLTVPGVAKVEIDGALDDTIVISIPQNRLANVGISLNELTQLLDVENAVQQRGSVRTGDRRIEIPVRDGFSRIDAISTMQIGDPSSGSVISLADIADISIEPDETPDKIIRFNGHPAISIAVSMVEGTNVVDIGAAVNRKLETITYDLPVGVTLASIYDQASVVDEAVNGFVVSLALSVGIVIAILLVFMGWRAGIVVGGVLLLTVAGTVLLMHLFGINMQRISLGALIIAMGMLVDNAIVVAEGMMVSMQRGIPARKAATDIVRQTQIPLLGATIIGIMAFSGIGLSPDATGEFMFSLFAVIGISLLLSWVLAVVVIPLFGKYLLKQGDGENDHSYSSATYRLYGKGLDIALKLRWLSVSALVATTAICIWGFSQVQQAFFPESNTPMFYAHYWMPQGSDIAAVQRDLAVAEKEILAMPGVVDVSSFAGGSAQRFMLTYNPEDPNSAYGQLLIRTETRDQIPDLAIAVRRTLENTNPDALAFTKRMVFGPAADADIEARFSGPDPKILRALANQAEAVLANNSAIDNVRNDWRQRELTLEPVMSPERAEISAVDRAALADTIKFSTDGLVAGSYRDGDETIQILLRTTDLERGDLGTLPYRLVWSSSAREYVPVSQIVDQFRTGLNDTLINRRDRLRTLTVQANVAPGPTVDSIFRKVRPEIEAIPLPRGYTLEWGGVHEQTVDAQSSLGEQLPAGFLIMLLITVLLFGKLREPIIIWLTVPMAICGVTIGLLITGFPFGFTALLGMLSLSGMLIKNAIVLLDEINLQISSGVDPYEAIIKSGQSRLRPVALAAATTILGMIPLIFDALFASMAITIMGGLAFATVLTLFAVPVLYAIFYRIHKTQPLTPSPDDRFKAPHAS